MTIREYSEKDIEQIVDLNQRVFSQQEHFDIKRDEKWFRWKNIESPFGKSIVIVAENEDGKIVGSRVFWPWKFRIRTSEVLAYQPIDAVVDPRYQGRGLFYTMTVEALKIALNNEATFIFNFSNKNSLPRNLSFGWSFVSKLIWYVKIINPLYVFNMSEKAENIHQFGDYKLTERTIDEMKFRTNFDGYIKPVRSLDLVKWRYLNHPFFTYGIVHFTDGKSTIWAIFSVNSLGKYRDMFVVDIFGDYRLIGGLLVKLREAAKYFNVSAIYILKNPYIDGKQMLKNGYVVLKSKNLVCLPIRLELEPKLLDYNQWEMFGGLHDAL